MLNVPMNKAKDAAGPLPETLENCPDIIREDMISDDSQIRRSILKVVSF